MRCNCTTREIKYCQNFCPCCGGKCFEMFSKQLVWRYLILHLSEKDKEYPFEMFDLNLQVNGFNPHSESNSTLGHSTDQMNHLNSVNSNAHLTRWVTLMVIVTVMVETYPNIPTQNLGEFWGRGRPSFILF